LSLIKEKKIKLFKRSDLCLAQNGQVHRGEKFVHHFVHIAIFCALSKLVLKNDFNACASNEAEPKKNSRVSSNRKGTQYFTTLR
jgi:hypothetical protein